MSSGAECQDLHSSCSPGSRSRTMTAIDCRIVVGKQRSHAGQFALRHLPPRPDLPAVYHSRGPRSASRLWRLFPLSAHRMRAASSSPISVHRLGNLATDFGSDLVFDSSAPLAGAVRRMDLHQHFPSVLAPLPHTARFLPISPFSTSTDLRLVSDGYGGHLSLSSAPCPRFPLPDGPSSASP
ncbi:hypothetical protein MSAN_00282100 [Mycena sanguinolenta]|uniref:Uncharacterized protein n=1 Tax=Mycena sanguinolenta TaxID=230812 RepID=A0A8H6ZAV4_9AGAR|nr:hypothetical protein MSAN_00282100 [Mycena sanguinolenta]